jgi:hypothetical protein
MTEADRSGRRRPRAGVPRNRRLDLRVSDDELAELRTRAAAGGVSIQRLMVDAALKDGLGGGEAAVDAAAASELTEARRELARIGNNVNQLVRLAHSSQAAELDALAAEATALLRGLAIAHKAVEDAAASFGRRRH